MKTLLYFFVLLSISGCADLSPYQRSAGSLSQDERKTIFDKYRVSYDALHSCTVGGQVPPYHLNSYAQFEKYFSESGDGEAANMLHQAWPYRAGALVTLATSVIAAQVLARNSAEPSYGPYVALGIGLGAEFTIITWSGYKFFQPATQHFNEFLKEDLKIDDNN